MLRRSHATLSLLAALAIFCTTAAAASPPPLVPLLSAMRHWDNHWYVWLPQDPVYEAVEVMSLDRGPAGRPVVWAFFTERAGAKHQVHYVDDAALARAEGWTLAPMSYAATGTPGAPRGLTLTFRDGQGRPVSIRVDVSGSAPLSPGGLTDQIGHAAQRIFLMFHRDQNTFASDWAVSVAGRRVSGPGPDYVAPFKPAYSRDITVAALVYGREQARFAAPDGSRDAGVVSFRPSGDGTSYVASLPDRSRETIGTDPSGQTLAYVHADGSHALEIRFGSPLPPACGPFANSSTPFSISLDGHEDLFSGNVEFAGGAGKADLTWTFSKPRWALAQRLHSRVVSDCRSEERVVLERDPPS